MIDNNIKELAKGLLNTYEKMYNIYYPEVERIITYQIRDINLIENTLDHILDIYTEKGFYLFLKLVFYYSTVDIEKAYKYIDILKDIRHEEYEQYVKTLKRTI